MPCPLPPPRGVNGDRIPPHRSRSDDHLATFEHVAVGFRGVEFGDVGEADLEIVEFLAVEFEIAVARTAAASER